MRFFPYSVPETPVYQLLFFLGVFFRPMNDKLPSLPESKAQAAQDLPRLIERMHRRYLDVVRIELAQQDIAVVCSRVHKRPAIATPLRRAVERGDHGFLSFENNDLAAEW